MNSERETKGVMREESMIISIARRYLLTGGIALLAAGIGLMPGTAAAEGKDSIVIGWPSDVPSWDPNARTAPDAQPIFKAVFDQPIDQNPDLSLRPNIIKSWSWADDSLSLTVELRDDVLWHNGDKLTAEDLRYTFFERFGKGHKVDTARVWRNVTDIEVVSPTKAVIKFKQPMVTAIQWFTFLASFVVPKNYMESVGVDGFVEKPVGSGPYKLVEYQRNSRIVLERFDDYWGPKPAVKRVIIEIIKDASARVAAVQSGRVDLTVNVPVREALRLNESGSLSGELSPITRVILLQIRNDQGFSDRNIRLAAHHAIDKQAISKAFYNGVAVPLSVVATPGTPGYVDGFTLPYDPKKAVEYLKKAGYGPDNPAKIKMAATNGHFPNDFEIARAIVAMWKKVGIDAELETIEYGKYFELNRGNKLPEATLYTWDNATGDPEMYTGYLLHPKLPFSAWKDMDVGGRVMALFGETDYAKRIQGYKDVNVYAVETGAAIPLLQSVLTVVANKDLQYRKYANGWILPQFMSWK